MATKSRNTFNVYIDGAEALMLAMRKMQRQDVKKVYNDSTAKLAEAILKEALKNLDRLVYDVPPETYFGRNKGQEKWWTPYERTETLRKAGFKEVIGKTMGFDTWRVGFRSGNRPIEPWKVPFWVEIGTVKMIPRPFLFPAASKMIKNYRKELKQSMITELNKTIHQFGYVGKVAALRGKRLSAKYVSVSRIASF